MQRFYKVLAGPELGLSSSIFFAILYVWPLLTLHKPSDTFKFMFGAWIAHVALLAAISFASKRLEASEALAPVDPLRKD